MQEHADESADGSSSLRSSEGSTNNHNNKSSESMGSDQSRHGDCSLGSSLSTSRFGQQLSSLAATPEEEGGESSDESGTSSSDEENSDKSRRAKERRSQKHRSAPGFKGTSVGFESSADSNDPGRRGGGGSGASLAFGRQRGDIERMPDPSIVDWEVAVVMASNGADDMVRWTVPDDDDGPARETSEAFARSPNSWQTGICLAVCLGCDSAMYANQHIFLRETPLPR